MRTDQLLDASDLLNDNVPIVEDELQIQIRNTLASSAGARRGAVHGGGPIPKRGIGHFDQFKECLTTFNLVRKDIGEHGVAFQLGKGENRIARLHDHFKKFGQDFVSVVQFGFRQKRGVARNISQKEVALVRLCVHVVAPAVIYYVFNVGWVIKPPLQKAAI